MNSFTHWNSRFLLGSALNTHYGKPKTETIVGQVLKFSTLHVAPTIVFTFNMEKRIFFLPWSIHNASHTICKVEAIMIKYFKALVDKWMFICRKKKVAKSISLKNPLFDSNYFYKNTNMVCFSVKRIKIFNTYRCGHPWQIFWSAKDPPKTLLNIAGWPKAFKASSKLSTKELKNSKASCCSRRFTGSPQSLKMKAHFIKYFLFCSPIISLRKKKIIQATNPSSLKSQTTGFWRTIRPAVLSPTLSGK